jgi:D-amino peptidase
MEAYISIDMEGIAGIATRDQCRRGTDSFPASQHLMTMEANAAVAGAFDGGATRVVVNDSHGDMANLTAEEMDPRAELVIGSPKVPYSMMQGIGNGFTVAMFIGYHAAAGEGGGVLAHTYSGMALYEVRLNGQPMSEAELNAVLAATHRVPVGLVTGDDITCARAEKSFPGCRTVAVKTGMAFQVASSIHPELARERIRSAARDAMRIAPELAPYDVAPPYELEVDLSNLRMAELCALIPGTERIGGRTVRYTSQDFAEAFRCLIAFTYIANA